MNQTSQTPINPSSRCDQAHELLVPYSLGIASPSEARFVERMLDLCPDLPGELQVYLELMDGLAHIAPQKSEPPPVDKLLARVQAEESAGSAPHILHTDRQGADGHHQPVTVLHHHHQPQTDPETLLRYLHQRRVALDREAAAANAATPAATEPAPAPLPLVVEKRRSPRLWMVAAAAAFVLFMVTNVALIAVLLDVQRDQQQIALLLETQNAPATETPIPLTLTATLQPTLTLAPTETASPTQTPTVTPTLTLTPSPIPPSATPVPAAFEQTHTRRLTADSGLSASALLVWNSSERRVYISVDGLPALEAGQVYQIWAVRDETQISLGQFRPGEDGVFSDFLEPPTEPIETFELIGISVEPESGSRMPTSDHIITAQI